MPNLDPATEKMQKTLCVLGGVNLLVSSLYLVDIRIGLAMSLIANGLLISQLHDIGKKRRPGSNALNQVRTFFSGTVLAQNSPNEVQSGEVDNALRNVINGGAAIHDELHQALSSMSVQR